MFDLLWTQSKAKSVKQSETKTAALQVGNQRSAKKTGPAVIETAAQRFEMLEQSGKVAVKQVDGGADNLETSADNPPGSAKRKVNKRSRKSLKVKANSVPELIGCTPGRNKKQLLTIEIGSGRFVFYVRKESPV